MTYKFKCKKCGVIEIDMKPSQYKAPEKCPKCNTPNPERIWKVPSQNYSMGTNGFCGRNHN